MSDYIDPDEEMFVAGENIGSAYDWNEVFAYCQSPHFSDGSKSEPFTAEDVTRLLGAEEGENDELDWIAAGRLRDGRWFVVRAGCDYTGWD